MADVRMFAEGGYRYIKAVFQYSGGVAAQPGFATERALLSRPLPLLEGFAAIKAHLKRLGRPLAAFCPAIDPPPAVSFHAFSYTVPEDRESRANCVIAGGADCPEGRQNYRDYIVARGDTSPEGLRSKVRFVVAEMNNRLAALDASWSDASAAQMYTVQDIGALVESEILRPGPAHCGLTWQFCRPPIVELEFEMDVRAVREVLV